MNDLKNDFLREELKKYFFEYIDKKIIDSVKKGESLEHITKSYILIEDIFKKLDSEFSQKKEKENIFAKKGV